MKNVYLLSFLFLFISACNSSRISNRETQLTNNYAIAYNVALKDPAGKSNYEVFTIGINGKNQKNISNNPDVAWTYTAYKNRLYFVSDRDTCYRCYFLYETDITGGNIKKVSTLQLEDSYMDSRNEGSELIVSGREGKDFRYQLYLINTKTGTYNRITRDTAAMYSDPAWSPDGKQIVFVYKKNKRDRTQHEELYIMNMDGSQMKQLTHYPQDNISRQSHGYKAGSPHWHPTENFITYISMQNGKNNIFAVTPDGEKNWRLTNHDYSEGWHSWSPDGNWLVFDMANKDETQYHIMLMNWKTKDTKQLTDTLYKYQQAPLFLQK